MALLDTFVNLFGGHTKEEVETKITAIRKEQAVNETELRARYEEALKKIEDLKEENKKLKELAIPEYIRLEKKNAKEIRLYKSRRHSTKNSVKIIFSNGEERYLKLSNEISSKGPQLLYTDDKGIVKTVVYKII